MKRYKDYMDGVEASDTLHQRLVGLETPRKRPAAWKKYGAAAAALVLAAGLGAWGLSQSQGGWDALMDNFRPNGSWEDLIDHFDPAIGTAEVGREEIGEPDIAYEDPGHAPEPGMKTNGGYEVVHEGEGPDTMVSYYFLPYIEYGMAKDVSQMALDWDVPQGSTTRDLTRADIAALFGREKTLSDHLAWGDYELSGWAAWYGDGSLWGVFLNGDKGERDRFELAFVTGGRYPPTCIMYGDGVANEIWDVSVTAWGYDGPNGYDRRVEFLNDGCGFRFDLTAADREQAEMLVSRLVRWIAVEGLELDTLTDHGAVPAHPWEADPNWSVGEPIYEENMPDEDSSIEDFYCDCPECIAGTVHTHPYDPNMPAEAKAPTPPN